MSNADIYKNAPLFQAATGYIKKEPARFHTPGHKANPAAPCGFLGKMLAFDLTELPETDSLFEAEGAILRAEEKAARAFGTAQTLLSAGGATLCIQAMLRLASQSGRRKVILARNVHISAVNAVALLGLEPVWVWPRPFEGSALPGAVAAGDVGRLLAQNVGVAAVYVTSPDYYGVMSDIRAIAQVCGNYKVPLLVDCAHGAHLHCLDGGAMHPVRLGAAMACDSAHKTLPVPTGGAWLQIAHGASGEEARSAMALFGSTSPSYPVMIALDLARAWMEAEGAAAYERLRGRVDGINRLCAEMGFFRAKAAFDPTRVTIDTASLGLSGTAAAESLRRAGVSPEMATDRHIVLLPSPFNTEDDFERLQKALRALPLAAPVPCGPDERPAPEAVMTPREALMAPGEAVRVEESAGRVAAESRCPCPPGVPVVMPGELIDKKLAGTLKNYGVMFMKVVK